MKITDGLKLPGPRVEIPNSGRDDFAKFLHDDMGFRTGVEIGVNKGIYSKILCKAGLKVYGVDLWENYDGYKREGHYKSEKEVAMERLAGYDWTPVVKYSMDALQDFDDFSLDFVYIDGNHTLPYVVQDIFNWHRKIKIGGIVSGHDYAMIKGYSEDKDPIIWDGCHVKAGVDACVQTMKIRKLYILGERKPVGNNWRDKWRSWFYVKER